jgi:large subunit ribosomal protein L30
MADLVIRQVRSANGSNGAQRETLRSLGLGKIGRSVTHKDNPQTRGMVRRVSHLVELGGKES